MHIDSIGERFDVANQYLKELPGGSILTANTPDTTSTPRCATPCRPVGLLGALIFGTALSMAAPVEAAAQDEAAGVCDRTEQVRDEILRRLPYVADCASVTATDLHSIGRMVLTRPNSLTAGDFAGLTSLAQLKITGRSLRSLPSGIFDGLTSLRVLHVTRTRVRTLPAHLFANLASLETLELQQNRLRTLPEGVFAGLTSLETLELQQNRLRTLPEGAFAGLTSLETLDLSLNSLRAVPSGIFDGLASLNFLHLESNRLSTIPAGLFSNVPALTQLLLNGNELREIPQGALVGIPSLRLFILSYNPDGALAPLSIPVSLEPVGLRGFRAVAPTGVPFAVRVPVDVTNGRIDGAITAVTIPVGATESNTLTVTRGPDTVGAMTAAIGALPYLPFGHAGYQLTKTVDASTVLDESLHVTRIAITSDPGDDGHYAIDDVITVQADFSRPVAVEGIPTVMMQLSWRPPEPASTHTRTRTVGACYSAGSGTPSLTFSWAVREGVAGSPALQRLITNIGPALGTGSIVAEGGDELAAVGFNAMAQDTAHSLDGYRPTLRSAVTSADGTTIVLAFDEPLAAATAPGTAFAVTADDDAVAVRTATVSGRNLTLTLDSAVSAGQAVRVSYAEPTTIDKPMGANTSLFLYGVCGLDFANDDTQAVQDRAGNDARAFSGFEVANMMDRQQPTPTERMPDSALSVADAQVHEAAGATVAFEVSLSRAVDSAVTVAYATNDDTARAGEDYVAASGTLTFAPSETLRTVEVTVLDDAHDEGTETFTLALDNASGAVIADNVGVGTIVNDDPIPKAWLARFGRTAAQHVLDGVEWRFAASRTSGFEATLAGRSLAGAPASRYTSGDDPYAQRGLESQAPSARDLLDGAAFSLTGGSHADGYVSLWGRGAASRFDGREDDLSLDGEMTSTMLGVDYASGRWLGGVVLDHSRGDGGYRGPTDGGEVVASLTGMYPYWRYAPSDRLSVWTVAGYGEGELALTPEDRPTTKTAIALTMAGVGARHTLVPGARADGFELALTSDALFTRTRSREVRAELAASSAATSRLRLGLEASRTFLGAGGTTLTPRLETALRHDGGDAERGFGADIGTGLAFSVPAYDFSGEVAAHALLAHDASGLRDRGLSGSLSWDPRPRSTLGPSLSFRHSIGAATSGGTTALLDRETLAGLGVERTSGQRGLEATLAYGSPLGAGRFVSIPEMSFGWTGDTRRYGLGWRLGLAQRGDVKLGLTLRAELAEGDQPDQRLALRTHMRW